MSPSHLQYLCNFPVCSYNNKTYRIDEIAWDKTPTDEFEGRNGEKLSYMKYYAEKYNRTIKDPKQPLLISIAKVCFIFVEGFIHSKCPVRNIFFQSAMPNAKVVTFTLISDFS